MRGALFATAGMNIGGAALFAPPARALRAVAGFPPGEHPLYLATVTMFVLLFGLGYLWAAAPARRAPGGQGMGAAAELERHRRDVALRHVDVPARRVAVDVAGERARIAPRLDAQRAGRGGGAELEARGTADLDPVAGKRHEPAPIEHAVGGAKPDRHQTRHAGPAAETHGRRLEAGRDLLVEARAVEPVELLHAARAPDVLLHGGRAVELVADAVDAHPAAARDLAVGVRHSRRQRQVMEEPRGAPRLARRRGEAERPCDAVPAALHLAAAGVVAQLGRAEADREALRRA